jgi:hypothetical protein
VEFSGKHVFRIGAAPTKTETPSLPSWLRRDMATDYDAPRRSAEEEQDRGIEVLDAASQATKKPMVVDDEANLGEDLELPGADLSDVTLTVAVVPEQADEFTCTQCFLVKHESQRNRAGAEVCADCA